jgi:hypothetical protein
MLGDGGLALLWRQVLSLPTVHSILGVDSAEADKVGSQGFRFCAYADCALYRGVWHRRTTPVRYCGLLYCYYDVRSQWAAAVLLVSFRQIWLCPARASTVTSFLVTAIN